MIFFKSTCFRPPKALQRANFTKNYQTNHLCQTDCLTTNGFIARLKSLTNRHNTAKVNSARPVARVQTVAPVQTSSGARVIKQLTPNQKQHLEYTIKTQMKAVVNKL
ncbi:MAG: hypothetical protein SPL73_06025 [Cyanobacteriota bacterium]|nr:hypothetical protein [Cyanobacteriota bacterium]